MHIREVGKCPYVLPVTEGKSVRVVGFPDGLPGQTNVKVKCGESASIVGWLLTEAIRCAHVPHLRSSRPHGMRRDDGTGELIKTHCWNDIVVETRTQEGSHDLRIAIWDADEPVVSLDAYESFMLDVQLKRIDTMLAEDSRVAALRPRTEAPAPIGQREGALILDQAS